MSDNWSAPLVPSLQIGLKPMKRFSKKDFLMRVNWNLLGIWDLGFGAFRQTK
jgi:hypothetical protein